MKLAGQVGLYRQWQQQQQQEPYELATAAAAANGPANPQRPPVGAESEMPQQSPREPQPQTSPPSIQTPPIIFPRNSNRASSPTTAHATSTTPQSQSRPSSTDLEVGSSMTLGIAAIGSFNNSTSNGSNNNNSNGGSSSSSNNDNNIRQLAKVKRFLSTLQQFGNDISPEVGEKVHQYIQGVVGGSISIDDFHAKIQEVTSYPLRPFVTPFLHSNLPLMQSDLLSVARSAKQSPQQYLRAHESFLLDPHCQAGEPFEIFHPEAKENSLKRPRSENRLKEEPFGPHNKRARQLSSNGVQMPSRLDSSHEIYRERLDRIDRILRPEPRSDAVDDVLRNIHNMLNCIIGLVEKTKRAVSVLQRAPGIPSGLLADFVWTPIISSVDAREQDVVDKKRIGDFLGPLNFDRGVELETRVSEVRRKAEEAVNEVKRHAVLELQKTLSAAESRTSELLAVERAKMNSILSEAAARRLDLHDHVMHPMIGSEDAESSCWNCGRRASETCSGCNLARYCGSFCQHKDWEQHHKVCGASGLRAATVPSGGGLLMPATSMAPLASKREELVSPSQDKAGSSDAEDGKDPKEPC
ncbi:protein CBFA2T3-like [Galendromus occidentalis]|uniref:Protein CBFA2T3-like n=1 Tax=Galendromus occidentalis TaxID=34638 RepID=A0AAJ7L3E0_9ACAR|nr:protein CBFA2T3-like [Galendromus occidentalis]